MLSIPTNTSAMLAVPRNGTPGPAQTVQTTHANLWTQVLSALAWNG